MNRGKSAEAAGIRDGAGAGIPGDVRDVLPTLPDSSVSLVFTSPPFALRRQKAYGNVAAADYIEWFWPIAVEIVERVPIQVPSNESNARYLKTKKDKLGHLPKK